MFGRKSSAERSRKTSAWEGVDYLDLVPRRVVEAAPAEADRVVALLVPRYRDAIWGRLLQPRLGPGKRYVRVPLEARGAAVWNATDGVRTVRDLVPFVNAVAPDDSEDLPRRVCLFVQAMVDNGFIAVERPGAGGNGAGD
ncbi:MAG: hypothetical protein IPI48_07095 [bacterium]|nr:hypothetical protein [bacterium]